MTEPPAVAADAADQGAPAGPDPLAVVLQALALGSAERGPAVRGAPASAAELRALLVRRLGARAPKLAQTLADFVADPATYERPARKVLRAAGADRDQEVVDRAAALLQRAEALRPGISGGLVGQINAQGGRVLVVGGDNRGTINTGNVYQLIGSLPLPALVALVVVLVAGVAAALGGPTLYREVVQPQRERRWPTPMSGQFNMVLAGIGRLDDQGRVVPWPDGDAIARQVHRDVEGDLEALAGEDTGAGSGRAAISGIQVRPPAWTRPLGGRTPEERARAAARLADELRADVVVYGSLKTDPASGIASFVPELYVSERRLGGASELVGQYELGAEMRGLGRPDSLNLRLSLQARLRARMRALPFLVAGLASYADSQFGEAADHFAAAQRTGGWGDRDRDGAARVYDGAELVHVLLGNTAGRRGDLDAAGAAYDRALQVRPGYARALVGQAEVRFQHAKGTCEAGRLDAAGLQVALDGYRAALAAPVQPASADIQTKVAFGVARVYLCLSQAGQGDHWAAAEREFQRIVADFEGGNARVRELAAEASAGLGFIRLPSSPDEPGARERYLAAAGAYRRATELTRRPDAQAVYYRALGHVYRRLQQEAEADAALARAEAAYEAAAELDPQRRRQYEQLRQDVRQERNSR